MSYTTNELLANSYYGSGILSREADTMSGVQASDALNWLNDILLEKTVDSGMIPYTTIFPLAGEKGKEKYFIPDLVEADTLTFLKDNVRFSMRKIKRDEYFGRSRVETVETLPSVFHLERQFGGADLYIFFPPDQDYQFEINGLFRLSEVALNQDLELTLDRFYISYLRYCLIDRICTEFNEATPVGALRQLGKYQSFIDKKSRPLDLSAIKTSSLSRKQVYGGAGFARLFTGFVP